MPNYYNIDTLLAEEELLVVRPSFRFAHLGHLDPDAQRLGSSSSSSSGRKRNRDGEDTSHHHALAEGTKIKMPLWAADRWSTLGFVRLPSLPGRYGRRMRERLEADPVAVDLRSKNEHYFASGMLLVDLVRRAAAVAAANNRRASSSTANSRRSAHAAAMAELDREALELRSSLLRAFAGERLRRNFDWTLSAVSDDVSHHIEKLSSLEVKMFQKGAEAASAVEAWRETGNRRIAVSGAALRARAMAGVGRALANASTTSAGGWGGGPKRVVSPQADLETVATTGGNGGSRRGRF